MIFAIDPGNIESAYAILRGDLSLQSFGKIPNEKLIDVIKEYTFPTSSTEITIEMIASYGMAVGKTVFDTCVWIGRFTEAAQPKPVHYIYRKDEKMNLCGSMKAKDGNIRQALIDRFGEVGTKKNPGWFYGVSKDVWAAIAVGVTYHDMKLTV